MDKDSRALRLRTNLYRMYQGQLTFLLGAVGVSLSLPLFALLRPLATVLAALVIRFVPSPGVLALAGLVSVAVSIWAIVRYMGYLKGSSRVF